MGAVGAGEGVFHDDVVLFLAEDETERGAVAFRAHLAVDGFQVEVHLAGKLRLEPARLEFDHDVAVEPHVVEEQVDEEFVSADGDPVLAADVGEPLAEFHEEAGHVGGELVFEVAFPHGLSTGDEIEEVAVLEDALGEVRLGAGERGLEVGEGGALVVDQAAFDLGGKDGAAPAVLNGLEGVPEALARVLELADEVDVLPPGDFSHDPYENLRRLQFSHMPWEISRSSDFCNGPLQKFSSRLRENFPKELLEFCLRGMFQFCHEL